MLRLIKYLILFLIALCLVTIAMGNREPMTVQLLPDPIARLAGFNLDLTLPGFMMVLTIFCVGLLFGFIWEWLREHKHRADASRQRREKEQLAREVDRVKARSNEGKDDVLAMLEDAR